MADAADGSRMRCESKSEVLVSTYGTVRVGLRRARPVVMALLPLLDKSSSSSLKQQCDVRRFKFACQSETNIKQPVRHFRCMFGWVFLIGLKMISHANMQNQMTNTSILRGTSAIDPKTVIYSMKQSSLTQW